MAKANLPVNFKDDILKENMNGKRRFNMIQNSDGTVSFEDVTEYTQVGSTFGAAQINATNEAVNNAADASKIIDSLETIKANTQSGYIAGALAVKALSSNLGSNRLLYVANLNASGLSTTGMFSTIATDPNDIITLSDKNIVINQSGSLKIVISGNGNVTSGNAAIKINGSLVLSVSGTSANNSKTINVSKGDIITGSCYAGSYGGYMNNRITMYYEP